MDDKSKANLVQIKGRFSVTSENLDLVKVRLYDYFNFLYQLTGTNLKAGLGYSIEHGFTAVFTGPLSLFANDQFWVS